MKKRDAVEEFLARWSAYTPHEHEEAAEAAARALTRTPDEPLRLPREGEFIYMNAGELAKYLRDNGFRAVKPGIYSKPGDESRGRAALRELASRYLSAQYQELEKRAQNQVAVRKAGAVLDFATLLMPKRLVNEEIGDAIEAMHIMAMDSGCPRWKIWLKVFTTCFWIGLNAMRNITSAVLGKKAE